MSRHPANRVSSSPGVADRVFATVERFLHVEAVGGAALLVMTAVALAWANSPVGDAYQHFLARAAVSMER